MSEQLTAIVLAAGAGTRMKSARAKVLHEIAGRPLIGHALEAVRQVGVTRTVAVIGHQREEVGPAISAIDPAVVQVVQERQGGTGHAVKVALDALDETPTGTVLITYGDVPLLASATLVDLIDAHRTAQRAVTIVTSMLPDPTGYGRILRDGDRVVAIREHRDATDEERRIREVNSGILAADAAFLRRAVDELEASNDQGELYLTDIVESAVRAGLPVGAHVLEDVWQAEGVNDRAQLARLGAELNRRITDRWMRAGVTIVDPATTWIDSDVTFEPDVTVLPNTQLLGATSIHTGATIGPDTTLRNVEVGLGASVIRTHGSDSLVAADATVGPFAYLRPGNEIGRGAKIGTFVEAKNSRLAPGAKVPHLSYVGDAEIGENTNVGAGAITANYDGVNKHRTTIGDEVKIGCHNVFVAPVTIGDGAWTGAGTVVRRDVPNGALAVPAAGQRTIDDWVENSRPDTASARAAHRTAPSAAEQQEPPE